MSACSFLQDHPRLKDKGPGVPPVVRVELVQKTNLWGYQGGMSRPYLKVVCALPNLVAPARGKSCELFYCCDRLQRHVCMSQRQHAVLASVVCRMCSVCVCLQHRMSRPYLKIVCALPHLVAPSRSQSSEALAHAAVRGAASKCTAFSAVRYSVMLCCALCFVYGLMLCAVLPHVRCSGGRCALRRACAALYTTTTILPIIALFVVCFRMPDALEDGVRRA
jgi:hypothetical protein